MKKILYLLLITTIPLFLSGCTAENRDGFFYHLFVKPMDILLKNIFDIVGSWGLAIIIITIIIRLIIMPFMLYNYKHQRDVRKGMELARPELDIIQKKLAKLKKDESIAVNKEDKLRIRSEQMELQKEQMVIMKKYNASPMSVLGCLPILIQMPFLTGIYFTLINPLYSEGIKESVFLGIFNLGSRSYILPIIAFVVYAFQIKLTMKLSPQIIQPGKESIDNQMKIMQWSTPIMVALISLYVAGAVGIYYIVGGVIIILQTYLGNKLYPSTDKQKFINVCNNSKKIVSKKNKRKK